MKVTPYFLLLAESHTANHRLEPHGDSNQQHVDQVVNGCGGNYC